MIFKYFEYIQYNVYINNKQTKLQNSKWETILTDLVSDSLERTV